MSLISLVAGASGVDALAPKSLIAGIKTDDVADAEQLGRRLDRDVATFVGLAEDLLRGAVEEVEQLVAGGEERAEAKADEDRFCAGAALLADDQHLGARGAFRVDQRLCFIDDQRAAQRDHHQDAEQTAEHRDQDHLPDLEVVAEDQKGRHGDADAERDALARAAGGLRDVVFKDGRAADAEDLAEGPEDGDREHRDRDRRADRQADLEHQVHRAGAKDEAEQGADHERHHRQLGDLLIGGDVRFVHVVGGRGQGETSCS